jgi:hypothetical protein
MLPLAVACESGSTAAGTSSKSGNPRKFLIDKEVAIKKGKLDGKRELTGSG